MIQTGAVEVSSLKSMKLYKNRKVISQLNNTIEHTRLELYRRLEKTAYNLHDTEVLSISRKLDRLLNLLHRCHSGREAKRLMVYCELYVGSPESRYFLVHLARPDARNSFGSLRKVSS